MSLLASIRPEDVDPESPHFDYTTFTPRVAGRAIIFDGDKVALIYIRARAYYMLPGGGVEDEDIFTALTREIMEEVGCKVKLGQEEVGSIELYIDRWHQRQTDHCYVAQKVGGSGVSSLTDFEKSVGFTTIWAHDITEAARLIHEAVPTDREGRLIQARELLFLQTAESV